jgi:lysophospholipase L1-like esterase
MKKIILLLIMFVGMPVSLASAQECSQFDVRVATTPIPPQTAETAESTDKLLAAVPDEEQVIFLGDSQIERWPDDDIKLFLAGRSFWKFGVRQDKTQNLLWRLDQPEVKKLKKVRDIVLWVGTNNFQQPACAISAGQREILKKISAAWPDAHVYLVPMLPRGPYFNDYDKGRLEANAELRSLTTDDKRYRYVTIDDKEMTCGVYGLAAGAITPASLMCMPEAWPGCSKFRSDHLHLTSAGYADIGKAIIANWKD